MWLYSAILAGDDLSHSIQPDYAPLGVLSLILHNLSDRIKGEKEEVFTKEGGKREVFEETKFCRDLCSKGMNPIVISCRMLGDFTFFNWRTLFGMFIKDE